MRERGAEPRGPGYLITGWVLGLALGLFLAWWVWPVEYRDVAPHQLRQDFRDVYRTLIAVAYWARPDPVRAQARLALLRDPDPGRALQLQAQQALAQSPWPWEPEALTALFQAWQGGFTMPLAAAAAPAAPTARASPSPTPLPTVVVMVTPTPPASPPPTTPTLVPTPIPLFQVLYQEEFCDPARPALLHIEVYDAQGNPLPGVVLEVSWPQGQERVVTGMKPELGLGYADFQMAPDVPYRLRIVTGSTILTGLQPPRCRPAAGEPYPGGWRIVFQALP